MTITYNCSAGSEDWDQADIGSEAKVQGARARLQNLMDRTDALNAIRDILANLVGTEEIALFQLDRRKAALWLQWCQGVDPDKYAFLDIMEEPVLEQALIGKVFFRGDHGYQRLLAADDSVNALIPIAVSGRPVGLLVIFRLLPQKPHLDAADRRICEAIASYVGLAIARPEMKPIEDSGSGQKEEQ